MESRYTLTSEEIIGYFDEFSGRTILITRNMWYNDESESFLGTIRFYDAQNNNVLLEFDVVDSIVLGKLIHDKGSELYDSLVENVVATVMAKEQQKKFLEDDDKELI